MMTTSMVTKTITPLIAMPALVPTEREPLESEAIYIDIYQWGVVIIILLLCLYVMCVYYVCMCVCVCVCTCMKKERELYFYLIIHCTFLIYQIGHGIHKLIKLSSSSVQDTATSSLWTQLFISLKPLWEQFARKTWRLVHLTSSSQMVPTPFVYLYIMHLSHYYMILCYVH